MLTLIDWILALFRSEDAARAFVAAPNSRCGTPVWPV